MQDHEFPVHRYRQPSDGSAAFAENDLLPNIRERREAVVLHLEYVDLFYSHRYDPATPLEETLQALVDIVRQGKALRQEILTPQLLTYLQELNERAAQRGETLAQMALAWILHQRGVTSVLVGASSTAQLEKNLCSVGAPAFDCEIPMFDINVSTTD